jgi:hypothetical protein
MHGIVQMALVIEPLVDVSMNRVVNCSRVHPYSASANCCADCVADIALVPASHARVLQADMDASDTYMHEAAGTGTRRAALCQ